MDPAVWESTISQVPKMESKWTPKIDLSSLGLFGAEARLESLQLFYKQLIWLNLPTNNGCQQCKHQQLLFRHPSI
jgi:hypothetical protein